MYWLVFTYLGVVLLSNLTPDSSLFVFIDTKKMPLGKLSKSQIAKGFDVLDALDEAGGRCGHDELQR